jgi:hypothetical protein
MSNSGETKGRASRIVGGIAATVIAAAAVVGGVAVWNGVAQAQDAHAAYVASDHTFSTAMAESRSDDQQVMDDAVQRQHIDDVNAQVQAAEDAKAAAAAAAAQAAAEAAAQAQAEQQAQEQAAADDSGSASNDEPAAPSGPTRCPAGSQANSGDASGDTSCFPEICFHLVLPDPAHPECVTPFKP